MTIGLIWAIILAVLVVAIVFSIANGWVPPPNAGTLIRIRDGKVQVPKGLLRSDAKIAVEEILHDADVAEGWIAIMGETGVVFSRRIPAGVQQRLRNVLLNQWR